jgi:hypothetical protein
MDNILRDNSTGSILLLLVLSIIVNYRWFITIYKKFWKKIYAWFYSSKYWKRYGYS